MSERLITVRSYETPEAAHAARNHLAAHDVEAVVLQEATGGWMWHITPATGGVQLQVVEELADKAQKLLDVAVHPGPPGKELFWRCGECQENVEDTFEVCWSCSRPRTEVEDRDYEFPERVPPPPSDPSVDRVRRAWRAAVIGLVLCPPILNIYSMALLTIVAAKGAPPAPGTSGRFYGALGVNVLGIALAVFFWRYFLA